MMESPASRGPQNPTSSSERGSVMGAGRGRLGFWANAVNRKERFFHAFAMTGIFLLSIRSLVQKYRINDLREDNAALQQQHEALSHRINTIKSDLLGEASSADPSGLLASRLRLLFRDHPN